MVKGFNSLPFYVKHLFLCSLLCMKSNAFPNSSLLLPLSNNNDLVISYIEYKALSVEIIEESKYGQIKKRWMLHFHEKDKIEYIVLHSEHFSY